MILTHRRLYIFITALGVHLMVLGLLVTTNVSAITPLPTPDPKPGSYGIEATKTQEPPEEAATITTPVSGASFNESPITVNGLCTNELLVQVYNNGVLAGSVLCENGSFSLRVSLFAGTNELSATQFDNLEQSGPVSNSITVQFTDTNFSAFGQLITLTSSYGRRSAPAKAELSWPLQLTGGTGPYAFSIDWGDGSDPQLLSQPFTGIVTIAHTYAKAGIYKLNALVTDVNGVSAFLQVTAVASGQVDGATASVAGAEDTLQATQEALFAFWIPAAATAALLFPAFFLGRASEVVSLRKKMLKQRDSYKEK